MRAKESMWWPSVSSQIKNKILQCIVCRRYSTPPVESMIAVDLPERQWQRLGGDLFYLNGSTYLLLVDYFSRYPEVVRLQSLTAHAVIKAVKSVFSHHGIPEELHTDNGPQFDADSFKEFARTYQFKHTTSSPYYSQGNALAERTVKTVKSLMKSDDVYLALLTYRSTPFPWCKLSPAQLLMGRQLRSMLPVLQSHLTPEWEYLNMFRQDDATFKEGQTDTYDKRHRVRSREELSSDTTVWIKSGPTQRKGQILKKASSPRSYWVVTQNTTLRRNARHLTQTNAASDPPDTTSQITPLQLRSPIMTRTRTKTEIHLPERYRT